MILVHCLRKCIFSEGGCGCATMMSITLLSCSLLFPLWSIIINTKYTLFLCSIISQGNRCMEIYHFLLSWIQISCSRLKEIKDTVLQRCLWDMCCVVKERMAAVTVCQKCTSFYVHHFCQFVWGFLPLAMEDCSWHMWMCPSFAYSTSIKVLAKQLRKTAFKF